MSICGNVQNVRKSIKVIIFVLVVWMVLMIYILNQKYIKHVSYIKSDDDDRPTDTVGGLKSILMWTHNHTDPFNKFEMGRQSFYRAGCRFSNCQITNDRMQLKDIGEWDAILFHAPEYTWAGNPWHHGMPTFRTSKQIYVFVCIESAANYPVDDSKWDSYFNWTMTYRTDSDVPWFYLSASDSTGKVIAPAQNVSWSVQNISSGYGQNSLAKFRSRSKAVAWVVSNCNTLSKREKYADQLGEQLRRLNLTLDIYGKCGTLKCTFWNDPLCWDRLTEDYYFYLSFENSFSSDYTTEKLLNALEHQIVPIVLGGSDYDRFAPPNSYIDSRKHTPQELAALIHNLVNNFNEYRKYLEWVNYYTYSSSYDSPETNPFCNLCNLLNSPKANVEKTYKNFRKWWNK